MNIKQIRYFAATVKEGSFSAAAKDQYVTVQAVSKAISDLERETGYELFVRESRGVHPTVFGSALYAKAADVMHLFDELEQFPAQFRAWNERSDTMNICLCSPMFYESEKVCDSIARFIHSQMDLSVHVSMGTAEFGIEGLRSGAFGSIITIGAITQPDLECIPIGTVPPVVVMDRSHPLADKEFISLEDLDGYEIGHSSRFAGLNEIIASMYKKSGKQLVHHAADTLPAAGALYGNNGVSFALGVFALGEYYPNTIMKRVNPDQAVSIPVCLVNVRNQRHEASTALAQMLLGHLVNSAASH